MGKGRCEAHAASPGWSNAEVKARLSPTRSPRRHLGFEDGDAVAIGAPEEVGPARADGGELGVVAHAEAELGVEELAVEGVVGAGEGRGADGRALLVAHRHEKVRQGRAGALRGAALPAVRGVIVEGGRGDVGAAGRGGGARPHRGDAGGEGGGVGRAGGGGCPTRPTLGLAGGDRQLAPHGLGRVVVRHGKLCGGGGDG